METTPKNFALQIGSIITLFISIGALIALAFGVINLSWPDEANGYWEYDSAQASIRYAIALLVVFFPTFIVLTRMVNVARRNESMLYHTLTRWVISLALLIGGLVILGDLVAVIYTFLNGEITARFILKALTILVVVKSAFLYYWYDAKGYWKTHESQSITIAGLVSLVVLGAVVYGYVQIDKPSVVRDRSLDQQQVYDLQDMQWRIEAHFAGEGVLPKTVAEVYVDAPLVEAPEGREPYTYNVIDKTTYELCATFAALTPEAERMATKPIMEPGYNPNNFNWEHKAGEKCFERTVVVAEG